VIRVSLKQVGDAALKVDTSAAVKAQKQVEEAAKSAAAAQSRAAREVETATAAASTAASRASTEIVRGNARAADAFLKSTDAAARLARGIALLGVSSEKDMQKVVASIAQIQGSVDIAQGALSLLKLGPIGVAILVVVAAMAALTAGIVYLRREEVSLAEIEEKAVERRRKLANETERLASATNRMANLASTIGGLDSRNILQTEIERLSGSQLANQPDSLGKAKALSALAGAGTGSSFVGAADAKEAVVLLERETQIVEKKLAYSQQIAEIERQQVARYQQNVDAQKKIADEVRREGEEHRKVAEQLKNKQEGLELTFGGLKGRERAAAERLLREAQAGTLDERGAKKLSELGLETDESRGVRLAGARSRGSADLFKGLSDRRAAEESLASAAEAKAAEMEAKIRASTENNRRALESITSNLEATARALTPELMALDRVTTDFKFRIQALESRAQ
jgi:hypothetical protein